MVNVILILSLVYLVQLILPSILKRQSTEAVVTRAAKALHNLRESLPVFFTLAILSLMLLGNSIDAEANVNLALIWLALRIFYTCIYVSGVGIKPVDSFGYEAQPVRGLCWLGSIFCLIFMGLNLI
jgi:uncharacterized MAPEG superfamily protein